MAKRLKQQYLRLADNQELLQGVQGEIITADVLKPYIDSLATKTNAQDVKTAVDALENKLLGGVGLDGDTLSELYAKITTLQNLEQADKTGLLNAISAKADEASVQIRLNAKADEASVKTRLDEKANEASVQTRLDAKANEASVQTRLDAKANEASVQTRLDAKANEASVQTRLDAKITSAQAQTIAEGIAAALENKILGGVGTDTDTFAELKSYVDNLQNLSEADVNGVMQLVAQKVAKSDLYGLLDAISDSFYTGNKPDFVNTFGIKDFTAERWIGNDTSKVFTAHFMERIIKSLANEVYSKLGQTEFDSFKTTLPQTIEETPFSSIQTQNIRFNDGVNEPSNVPYFLSLEFGGVEGVTGGFASSILLIDDERNSMLLNLTQLVNFLANNTNSPVAQRIKSLEDRVLELEGMFENV